MTSESDKLASYLTKVQEASKNLSEVDVTPDELTFAVIRAQHVHVSTAHKSLKKACRTYTRRLWVRRFIYWGEMNAVTLGYLSFEEVEKP